MSRSGATAWMRAGVACLLITAAIAAREQTALAEGPPVTLDEYITLLEKAHRQASDASVDPSVSALREIQAALDLPRMVVMSDVEVELPKETIRFPSGSPSAEDFLLIAARLEALLDSARSAASTGALDHVRIRSSLQKAYAGIRQQPTFPQRLRRFAVRVLTYIGSLLGGLLNGSSAVVTLIGWLGVVALMLLITFLLFRFAPLLGFVRDQAITQREHQLAPPNWLDEAEKALGRGDLGHAVRAMFHALLQTLSERGLVVDDPALTAGECRAATAGIPNLGPQVAGATNVFEQVTYGESEASLEDVALIRAAEEAARAA